MVQTAGDSRKVLESDFNVMRALLENGAPFVLGHLPPCPGLLQRDERRPGGGCSPELRLDGCQCLVFPAGGVAFVADHPLQRPRRPIADRSAIPLDDSQPLDGREG